MERQPWQELSEEQLESIIAWGAGKVDEGQWLAMHLGKSGAVSDRQTPNRAAAVRLALKEANQLGWLPFVLTCKDGRYLLYAAGDKRDDLWRAANWPEGMRWRSSRTAFVHPVAQAAVARYLIPTLTMTPRGRLSALAA